MCHNLNLNGIEENKKSAVALFKEARMKKEITLPEISKQIGGFYTPEELSAFENGQLKLMVPETKDWIVGFKGIQEIISRIANFLDIDDDLFTDALIEAYNE